MHPAADLGLFASAVQDMDVDVEQPSIALQETHAIQSKQHPVNCAGKTINQLYAALQKTDSVYLLDADFKESEFNASDQKHVIVVAALFLSRELLDFDSISTVINTALHIIVDSLVPAKFRTYALNLVIFGFQNLQVGPVRSELLRLVNIGCWEHLVDNGTREFHMAADPDRSTLWSKSAKKLSMAKGKAKEKIQFERKFFSTLIAEFQMQLNHCPEEHALVFCSRVLELFADVLSQMSTRRYLIVLFQDHLVIPICRYSRYYQENSTSDLPFFRYLNMLCDYMNFEIDNVTGLPFTRDQVSSNRHASISRWQKECFVKAPEQLEAFIFCAVGSLDDPAAVKENFERLPFEDLVSFCQITGTRHASLDGSAYSQRFLIEAIVWILQKKPHMIDIFGDESLYPTEALIFDESRVPTKPKEHIALPKAGLLYLSINDYLSRHFTSEKVAFARQLRGEITDAVLRMSPQYNLDSETPFDRTIFTGWARNAIPLIQMQVDTVGAPNLAHITPSYVTADISYSVEKYSAEITNEWDHIRAGDILILISVQVAPGFKADLSSSNNFQKTFGIKSVRGCQVHQILADDGSPVSDFISAQKMDSDGNARIESSLRCLRVLLDPNQHMQDTRGKSRGPYDSFNIVLRRNHDFAKYKLETLRDIMQSPFAHDWLEHAILGYESPQTLPAEIDFHDTFLDWSHLTETYPNATGQTDPPFLVKYDGDDVHVTTSANDSFMTNTVRYTPAEIKAITSGMSDGISVINCPPGSNKQQVALQIIANLPNSTTLILSAANQIPALISKLEQFVPSRSILHLDRELDDLDLPHESLHGRQGRVNLFLAERLAHLDYVKRLAASLGIQGAFGENITNAMFFFKHHVQPLWQDFQKTLRKKSLEPIINTFPFMSFFNEGPQGDPAAQCRRLYASMEKVFHSLENMIVFELVKSTKDRSTYVLVKEARVIILSPEYISKVYREFRSLGVPIDSICVLDGDELAIVQSAALCTQVRRCIVMCLSRFKETAALDSQSVYPTSIYNVFRSVYNIQDVGQPRSSPAPKFVYDSQFVHVPTKATSIRADWVQNLDQAEFLVQTFMFMVKNGVDPNQIGVYAATAGQIQLLDEVFAKRYPDGREAISNAKEFRLKAYALVSLVSEDIPESFILKVAACGQFGLYMFGDKDAYLNNPIVTNLLIHPSTLIVKHPKDCKECITTALQLASINAH